MLTMTNIYFICGFIGSGKTTYAKRLAETKRAFRFSIDEWMIPLYGEHMDREDFDAREAILHSLFNDSALQLASLNVPVIFDFGFWKKYEREKAISWATENELVSETHYLDVPYETCKQRAKQRNNNLGGNAYEMTTEMLDLFWSRFETPSHEENVVRINSP